MTIVFRKTSSGGGRSLGVPIGPDGTGTTTRREIKDKILRFNPWLDTAKREEVADRPESQWGTKTRKWVKKELRDNRWTRAPLRAKTPGTGTTTRRERAALGPMATATPPAHMRGIDGFTAIPRYTGGGTRRPRDKDPDSDGFTRNVGGTGQTDEVARAAHAWGHPSDLSELAGPIVSPVRGPEPRADGRRHAEESLRLPHGHEFQDIDEYPPKGFPAHLKALTPDGGGRRVGDTPSGITFSYDYHLSHSDDDPDHMDAVESMPPGIRADASGKKFIQKICLPNESTARGENGISKVEESRRSTVGETLADRIYRIFGVPVPRSQIYSLKTGLPVPHDYQWAPNESATRISEHLGDASNTIAGDDEARNGGVIRGRNLGLGPIGRNRGRSSSVARMSARALRGNSSGTDASTDRPHAGFNRNKKRYAVVQALLGGGDDHHRNSMTDGIAKDIVWKVDNGSALKHTAFGSEKDEEEWGVVHPKTILIPEIIDLLLNKTITYREAYRQMEQVAKIWNRQKDAIAHLYKSDEDPEQFHIFASRANSIARAVDLIKSPSELRRVFEAHKQRPYDDPARVGPKGEVIRNRRFPRKKRSAGSESGFMARSMLMLAVTPLKILRKARPAVQANPPPDTKDLPETELNTRGEKMYGPLPPWPKSDPHTIGATTQAAGMYPFEARRRAALEQGNPSARRDFRRLPRAVRRRMLEMHNRAGGEVPADLRDLYLGDEYRPGRTKVQSNPGTSAKDRTVLRGSPRWNTARILPVTSTVFGPGQRMRGNRFHAEEALKLPDGHEHQDIGETPPHGFPDHLRELHTRGGGRRLPISLSGINFDRSRHESASRYDANAKKYMATFKRWRPGIRETADGRKFIQKICLPASSSHSAHMAGMSAADKSRENTVHEAIGDRLLRVFGIPVPRTQLYSLATGKPVPHGYQWKPDEMATRISEHLGPESKTMAEHGVSWGPDAIAATNWRGNKKRYSMVAALFDSDGDDHEGNSMTDGVHFDIPWKVDNGAALSHDAWGRRKRHWVRHEPKSILLPQIYYALTSGSIDFHHAFDQMKQIAEIWAKQKNTIKKIFADEKDPEQYQIFKSRAQSVARAVNVLGNARNLRRLIERHQRIIPQANAGKTSAKRKVRRAGLDSNADIVNP